MTQRDSNMGWFTITACWDSSCSNSWEDTSLSGFLGVFLQVITTHHQPVIKPFGLSTGKKPLKSFPVVLSHPYKDLAAASKRTGVLPRPWKHLHPRNHPNTTRSATYGHLPIALIISRQMRGNFSQFWKLDNLNSIWIFYLQRACSFTGEMLTYEMLTEQTHKVIHISAWLFTAKQPRRAFWYKRASNFQ